MADGRKNNGGHKTAGRKPKADEQILVEKMSPLMPKAYKALENAIEDGEAWAVKLSFEYRYGKPKQMILQKTVEVSETITKEEAKIIKEEILGKY